MTPTGDVRGSTAATARGIDEGLGLSRRGARGVLGCKWGERTSWDTHLGERGLESHGCDKAGGAGEAPVGAGCRHGAGRRGQGVGGGRPWVGRQDTGNGQGVCGVWAMGGQAAGGRARGRAEAGGGAAGGAGCAAGGRQRAVAQRCRPCRSARAPGAPGAPRCPRCPRRFLLLPAAPGAPGRASPAHRVTGPPCPAWVVSGHQRHARPSSRWEPGAAGR